MSAKFYCVCLIRHWLLHSDASAMSDRWIRKKRLSKVHTCSSAGACENLACCGHPFILHIAMVTVNPTVTTCSPDGVNVSHFDVLSILICFHDRGVFLLSQICVNAQNKVHATEEQAATSTEKVATESAQSLHRCEGRGRKPSRLRCKCSTSS